MLNSIQVVQDRFTVAGKNVNSSVTQGGGTGSTPFIRRPTRGIQIKEDTFATIRLVCGANGQNINLIDAGSRRVNADGSPITVNGRRATDIYSNFLLQKVHEERMEKAQILETFGEPYIFLFGERARIVSFQGILINTQDFNWEAEWWYNYDTYLRGTQAVQNDARVFIAYDETVVSGYIISASADKISGEPYLLNFQFQIFLTGYQSFSQLGNPYAEPGLSLSSKLGSSQLVTTAAEAAVFGPSIGGGSVGPANTKNFNSPLSLTEGFQLSIGGATQAWSQTSAIMDSVFSGVAGLITGSQVRIPYGFAGAMEFDNSPSVSLLTGPVYGEATKFGTYSQNDDEYVGAGSQYGSAITPGGVFRSPQTDLPYGISKNDLAMDQGMVNAAAAQWAKYGIDVSQGSLGPLSTTVLAGHLGLQPVALATVAASSSTPGTASAPFGAGLAASGFPG